LVIVWNTTPGIRRDNDVVIHVNTQTGYVREILMTSIHPIINYTDVLLSTRVGPHAYLAIIYNVIGIYVSALTIVWIVAKRW
jgi:hypothetical protein